jgi:BNR repeat-like domain
MSVPEQVPYKEYRATGSSNTFEITFYLPDPKDLVVMVNKEIPLVGAYSVQDNTVVFGTPPKEGDLVELTRDTQLDRETNFKSYDNSFRPETINFDLDKIWLVLQESNLVDAKILARLKQEIEWRRTHDFNYDELAQIREKQLFDALKGYTDTLNAATNPGVFQGVIAGVVFARDGKSIQTHLEEILDTLVENREAINSKAGQEYVDEQLELKAPKATTYSKTEVDSALDQKSAKADTYTKSQTDSLVGAVVGGHKGYTTLALAQAAQASFVIDSVVEVTNDPDPTKNGTYQWNGTTLTKSAYDPLTQAKNYSDEKASINSSANILELRDLYEKLIVLMRGNGDLYIPNLDKSVQKALKDIVLDVADIDTRVVYDDASSLFKIYDSNNKLIVSITNRGALIINDVVTKGGSVDNRLSNLESNAVSDTNTEILKATDYAIAARDKDPMLLTSNLFTQAELSSRFAFAVSLCRIAKNQYITFCESRMGGDFGETKIFTRMLTVNEDYSTTLGAISIVADSGVEATQPYSCVNSCSVRVDTGVHAGRVYLYFVKRFYENDRDETFYKYTDDNGLSWSADVPMAQFMPLMSEWRVVAVGPGKAIQLKKGAHAGRIILPCWHGDTNYPTSQAGLKSFILYSDDGGVTYTVGAESSVIGSNECQAAEIDNGNVLLLIRDGTSVKKAQVSTDGGITLQDYQALGDVTTTMVQSGICQFKNQFDLSVPKLIISTPAKGGVREDMGLYVSYDNLNWQFMGFIATGLGSYSDIVPLDESHILVAYSSGVADQNRNILSVIVNLKQIMLGA